MTPERAQKIASVLAKRQNDLTVILENVFDPHNVSAVMRTADAIGLQEIYVLYSQEARPQRWGFRSSGSAIKWVTVHQFGDVASCFEAVRKKYDRILTTHLSDDAVSLYQLDLTQKLALVFGNEHEGVSDEASSLADGNFIIPQAGMIHSLNISVACAVTLFEAFRQKTLAGHYQSQKLNKQECAVLKKQWGVYEENL